MALEGQPVGDLCELLDIPRGPWPELFKALVDELCERDRKGQRQAALDKLRGR